MEWLAALARDWEPVLSHAASALEPGLGQAWDLAVPEEKWGSCCASAAFESGNVGFFALGIFFLFHDLCKFGTSPLDAEAFFLPLLHLTKTFGIIC